MTIQEAETVPETLLAELKKVFESNFGLNLKGLILYGSAAGLEYRPDRSDINVLAVLDSVDPGHAAFGRKAFREWVEAHRVSPLYLTDDEITQAQDVFPMEFLEMQKRRRVLAGKDFLAGLTIDPANLRHQIEYELRGRLLMLRSWLTAGADPEALERGLLKSFNSALIILKSLLRLEQQDVPEYAAAVIRDACSRLKLESAPVQAVLELRLKVPPLDAAQTRSAAAGLHEWLENLAERVDRYNPA